LHSLDILAGCARLASIDIAVWKEGVMGDKSPKNVAKAGKQKAAKKDAKKKA
jgi:hypothetical protein